MRSQGESAYSAEPLHPTGTALEAESYSSFDDCHFPFRKWLPLNGSKPSKIVVALHGMSGASQDFTVLGEYLQRSRKDVAVYAPELRGQGSDPEASRRGDIQSRQEWFHDLHAFTSLVRQQHPQARIIWCGESMGALIALHSLATSPDGQLTCDALILSSPIVGTHEQIPAWRIHLLRLASRLLPRMKISMETLSGKNEVRVTRDSIHQEQAAKNTYHLPAFTLRLLNTLGTMIESSPQYAQRVTQPVLILHGGHDIFSQTSAVESLARKFLQSEGVTLHSYPESYHLLFYDHERERVLSHISQWIESLNP